MAQKNLQEVIVNGNQSDTLNKNLSNINSLSSKEILSIPFNTVFQALQLKEPSLQIIETGPNVNKPQIDGLSHQRVCVSYDGVKLESQPWGDEHGVESSGYFYETIKLAENYESIFLGTEAIGKSILLNPILPHPGKSNIKTLWISEYQSNNRLIGGGISTTINQVKYGIQLQFSKRKAMNYYNASDGYVYNTGFNDFDFAFHYIYKQNKNVLQISSTYFELQQSIPDGSRSLTTHQFTQQIFEADMDDLSKRPIVSPAALESYDISILHQEISHFRFYIKDCYKAWKFLSAYQRNKRMEFNHPLYPDLKGLSLILNDYQLQAKRESESNEFQINYQFKKQENYQATAFTVPDYLYHSIGLNYNHFNKKSKSLNYGITLYYNQITGSDLYVQYRSHFIPFSSGKNEADEQWFYAKSKESLNTSSYLQWILKSKQHFWNFQIQQTQRFPSASELFARGVDPGAHMNYTGNEKLNTETILSGKIRYMFHTQTFKIRIDQHQFFLQSYIYPGSLGTADKQGNIDFIYRPCDAWIFSTYVFIEKKVNQWKGDLLAQRCSGFAQFANYPGLPFMPADQMRISIERKHIFNIHDNLLFQIDWYNTQSRQSFLNTFETKTDGYYLMHILYQIPIEISKKTKLNITFECKNLLDNIYKNHLNRLSYLNPMQLSESQSGIFSPGRSFSLKFNILFIN